MANEKRFKDLLRDFSENNMLKPIDTIVSDLFSMYNGRAYHNINHVISCLDELDQLEKAIEYFEIPVDFHVVKLALWYHDVQPDEESSIGYFYEDFEDNVASCVSSDTCFLETVNLESLIRATKTDFQPTNILHKYMKDIDSSILGKSFDVFRDYEDNIRKEHLNYDEATFCSGRLKILRPFVDRPKIYYTNYFSDRYESQARINLKASIEKLELGVSTWAI
jgi:predicted metal-dependent HD superfamily phosphohydrolase